MPWLGVELVTSWLTGWHSIHWSTPVRAGVLGVFWGGGCFFVFFYHVREKRSAPLTEEPGIACFKNSCITQVENCCCDQLSYPARVLVIDYQVWFHWDQRTLYDFSYFKFGKICFMSQDMVDHDTHRCFEHLRGVCIPLLLGGMFWMCQLVLGWWCCWVLYPCGFSVQLFCQLLRGGEVSDHNYEFVYFSFQFSHALSSWWVDPIIVI